MIKIENYNEIAGNNTYQCLSRFVKVSKCASACDGHVFYEITSTYLSKICGNIKNDMDEFVKCVLIYCTRINMKYLYVFIPETLCS